MGKIQFNRGTTEVPTLKPGEPFFNNQDKLFIGKADGSGGKEIGEPETGATIKAKLEALEGDLRIDASAIKNLPEGNHNYKGFYENEAAITAAFPEGGQAGWYCVNGETDTLWIWDVETSLWKDSGSSAGGSAVVTVGEFISNGYHADAWAPDNYWGGIVFASGIRLYRMLSDGTLDDTFNPASMPSAVYAIAVDSAGNIYVGGAWSGALKRLTNNGAVDVEYDGPAFDGDVKSICIDADDNVYIGGAFTGKLKRILSDGSVDSLFTPPAFNGTIEEIICDPNSGYKYIRGSFTGKVKRLLDDGTIDSTYTPPVIGSANKIMLWNDCLVVGTGDGCIRLKTDGTRDALFFCNNDANGVGIWSMVIVYDNIVIGGGMTGEILCVDWYGRQQWQVTGLGATVDRILFYSSLIFLSPYGRPIACLTDVGKNAAIMETTEIGLLQEEIASKTTEIQAKLPGIVAPWKGSASPGQIMQYSGTYVVYVEQSENPSITISAPGLYKLIPKYPGYTPQASSSALVVYVDDMQILTLGEGGMVEVLVDDAGDDPGYCDVVGDNLAYTILQFAQGEFTQET